MARRHREHLIAEGLLPRTKEQVDGKGGMRFDGFKPKKGKNGRIAFELSTPWRMKDVKRISAENQAEFLSASSSFPTHITYHTPDHLHQDITIEIHIRLDKVKQKAVGFNCLDYGKNRISRVTQKHRKTNG